CLCRNRGDKQRYRGAGRHPVDDGPDYDSSAHHGPCRHGPSGRCFGDSVTRPASADARYVFFPLYRLFQPCSDQGGRMNIKTVGMTLEQLRIFVAVAEREHVTRAARDLNLTQSAASAAVASIEAFYQTRLFDRIGRRIALTDAGRV